MKVLREWHAQAPWGKIALMSWGDPKGYPVFVVHGRQDSSATFIPLMQHLPTKYHYVAMDLPGHGYSDPFPTGLMLLRFQNVTALDIVIKHLGWIEFYFLGHSLGTEQGLFINAIYPNLIKKMVLLDPAPAIRKIQIQLLPDHFETFHNDYYENYQKYNTDTRVFTKEGAVNAVMKARGLNREQAEMVLSRNMVEIGPDKYRLAWDRRLKKPAPLSLSDDYYFELFSKHCPPTLVFSAMGPRKSADETLKITDALFQRFQDNLKHFTVIFVEGSHDVHITNPERISKDICEFLEQDFDVLKSKL